MKKLTLFFISLLAVASLASCSKEPEPRPLAEDVAIIEKYLTEKSLTAQKTSTSLYYIIDSLGTGIQAAKNKTVSVHYKGYTTDGKVFDSSYDRSDPIKFTLGIGQVIAGWDEGIALFKKGGKGKLFIPSQLAYGTKEAGKIKANSVLIFEIHLVDVK